MTEKYLDPKEAIRLLLLDGEVLIDDSDKTEVRFDEDEMGFLFKRVHDWERIENFVTFGTFIRKPQKKKRPMTRWECLAWATSAEAQGWVITIEPDNSDKKDKWVAPQFFLYAPDSISDYRRAKLKPDGTGIDEATITDFSVEVES
jgi:hypothetical protein